MILSAPARGIKRLIFLRKCVLKTALPGTSKEMSAMAVIAISRQFGSGAEAIAQQVSEVLGYACLDKELISMVARETHSDERTIMRFDERGRHPILNFLMKYVIGEERIIPAWPTYHSSYELSTRSVREGRSSVSRTSCQRFFEDVIEKAWKRGDVVIVGRGAASILLGRPDVLSVRIAAPLEYRLQKVMLERYLHRRDAAKLIKRMDKERARFHRQRYGLKGDSSDRYRLSFDMGQTSEEEAIETICRTASGLSGAEIAPV